MDDTMLNEIKSELDSKGKKMSLNPELVVKIKAAICEITANIKRIFAYVAEKCKQFVDTFLYVTNDNPKWWHLCKYAKKARTRKKYRHLLMKQLYKRLQLER